MKVIFISVSSDSHYHGIRTDEFIASFKHFHPNIALHIFRQQEIDKVFASNPELTFYNSKATFAKLFTDSFDLVVWIDCDHLILGPLTSILKADYDVAAPASYNLFANTGITITPNKPEIEQQHPNVYFVPENQYIQGGIIASTSKKFWDDYERNSLKYSGLFYYRDNDVLNIMLKMYDYDFKYLEGHSNFTAPEFKEHYGTSSLGQEHLAIVNGDSIEINGRPIKAYHFAKGNSVKPHPNTLFNPQVVDYIYTQIIK